MPTSDKSVETNGLNGAVEAVRLQMLVDELSEECTRLKQALAESDLERKHYRLAFLEELRAKREFEELDLETLKAMSAGPVESIE